MHVGCSREKLQLGLIDLLGQTNPLSAVAAAAMPSRMPVPLSDQLISIWNYYSVDVTRDNKLYVVCDKHTVFTPEEPAHHTTIAGHWFASNVATVLNRRRLGLQLRLFLHSATGASAGVYIVSVLRLTFYLFLLNYTSPGYIEITRCPALDYYQAIPPGKRFRVDRGIQRSRQHREFWKRN